MIKQTYIKFIIYNRKYKILNKFNKYMKKNLNKINKN